MLKYIYVSAIVLLLAVIGYMAYVIHRTKKENTADATKYDKALSVTKQYNLNKIDSLERVNDKLDSTVKYYVSALQKKRQEQAAITDKYNKLSNEIHTTPDSGQLAITKRLLADIQRY